MVRLTISRSPAEAAAAVAAFVAGALRATPDLVLGLPAGRTPLLLYESLVDLYRRDGLDFQHARTFNLDEFAGLAPGDPRSYGASMARHFFARVNLPPAQTHVPDGAARDWRQAAAAYDRSIAEAGGIDLCLVGIGANGHLAFNEPAASLPRGTHRARLLPATRRANAHLFGGRLRDVPTHGLTLGLDGILAARAVLLLATGPAKAAIVARALTGPITTRVPASLLQLHPHALAVLDRAAAARLR